MVLQPTIFGLDTCLIICSPYPCPRPYGWASNPLLPNAATFAQAHAKGTRTLFLLSTPHLSCLPSEGEVASANTSMKSSDETWPRLASPVSNVCRMRSSSDFVSAHPKLRRSVSNCSAFVQACAYVQHARVYSWPDQSHCPRDRPDKGERSVAVCKRGMIIAQFSLSSP